MNAAWERVERWEREGDREAVVGPGVLAVAGRLWQAVLFRDGNTLEVVHALARLHGARAVVPGLGGPVDDFSCALTLYAAIEGVESVRVPDELRRHPAWSSWPLPLSHIGPEHWGRMAIRSLKEAQVDWDVAKLDAVVELLGGTVEAYPRDHEYWAGDLSNLSLALHMRYFARGDPADLDRAERAARAAVRATEPGHPDLPNRLDNLSGVLQYRAQRTGDAAAWTEAVQLSAQAVRRTPPDHRIRPMLEEKLAGARLGRSGVTGDVDELDQAIADFEGLVARTPENDPAILSRWGRLGIAYRRRYLRTGDPRPLHRAVELLTRAADSTPVGAPDREAALTALSEVLLCRFQETGDARDLDDAVYTAERSVEEGPGTAAGTAGAARRAESLHALGDALFAAAEYTGDPSLLDRSVEAFRAAVGTRTTDARQPDNPRTAAYRSGLSRALMARRFQPLGVVTPFGMTDLVHERARARWERAEEAGEVLEAAVLEDLDEAYEHRLRAVERAEPHHPDLGLHLTGLSTVAYARGVVRDRRDDAERALELAERAVRVTPARHPHRAEAVLHLAALLPELGGEAGADRALSLYRALLADPATPSTSRLAAAALAARALCRRGAWAAAVEQYAGALDLLPSLVTPALAPRAQEESLARWSGLATEAASCAIAAGDRDRAVELLEQGRGVLWSQLLNSRTELGELAAAEPELAGQLTAVERELNAPPRAETPEPWWDRIADRRLTLAAEREELVSRVRALPGFEGFRRPAGSAELRAAAAAGPIVLIVSSQWRTDALLFTTAGTRAVPLDVDQAELLTRTERYLTALHQYETGPRDALAQVKLNLMVTRTLEWLWRDIAEPPLRALEITGPPPPGGTRPRLWWCPTGLLALLPLHAAGLPDTGPDTGPDTDTDTDNDTGATAPAGDRVQDRVTPSYTPTLRALLDGRAAARPAAPEDRMLVVGLPFTPGHRPLPQVEDELAVLATAVPDATVLRDARANRRAVREALRTHRWAHLSCHGGQDLARPSQGGVVLHDAMLTVADLRSDGYAQGEFVFLSACQTALGGLAVPDEAMAVTSAFQYTGWRQVVGTLWSVGAVTAAEVTADLYHALATDGTLDAGEAALALCEAVRRLREAGHPPRVWAPFAHAGI
ncbi:CHAT domain-containing protein [Streptomyces mayteni]